MSNNIKRVIKRFVRANLRVEGRLLALGDLEGAMNARAETIAFIAAKRAPAPDPRLSAWWPDGY